MTVPLEEGESRDCGFPENDFAIAIVYTLQHKSQASLVKFVYIHIKEDGISYEMHRKMFRNVDALQEARHPFHFCKSVNGYFPDLEQTENRQ